MPHDHFDTTDEKGEPKKKGSDEISPREITDLEALETEELSPDIVILPNHSSVTGDGSSTNPYSSSSGTAGINEVLTEFGSNTRIYCPEGEYEIIDNETSTADNIELIGSGQDRTKFVVKWNPGNNSTGAFIDSRGTQSSQVKFWHLEGFTIENADPANNIASGYRADWHAWETIKNVRVTGFQRGIRLAAYFRFQWDHVTGKGNGKTVFAVKDWNAGVVNTLIGDPDNSNDPSGIGQVILADETAGDGANLGAEKPRGLVFNGLGGDGSAAHSGAEFRSAFGVVVNAPQFESFGSNFAIKFHRTGAADATKSRACVVNGGFFHNNKNAIELGHAIGVEVNRPYVQAPDVTSPVGVNIKSDAENTEVTKPRVPSTWSGTLVADSGVGTTENGIGEEASGGAPTASNWDTGDIVADTNNAGDAYLLLPSGSWTQIGT